MIGEEPKSFSVEEINEAPPPPERPVPPRQERQNNERPVDFIESFLKEEKPAVSTEEPGGDLYDRVLDALRSIYDPEIPVNIYDLGLIYGLEIDGGHAVVTMTLTTPHCPVAESMPGEVETRVGAVPGVGSAEVHLVWDPPWDPQKMSDEAKLELGML